MAQVIKFFGWLMMAIGATFALAANISQGLFNGWGNYWAQVQADPVGMSVMLVFLLPGAVVLSSGVLTAKVQRYNAARRAKKSADHHAES